MKRTVIRHPHLSFITKWFLTLYWKWFNKIFFTVNKALKCLSSKMCIILTILIMKRWEDKMSDIHGLVQDYSISSALAMEILQPCTKPLICEWNPSYISSSVRIVDGICSTFLVNRDIISIENNGPFAIKWIKKHTATMHQQIEIIQLNYRCFPWWMRPSINMYKTSNWL